MDGPRLIIERAGGLQQEIPICIAFVLHSSLFSSLNQRHFAQKNSLGTLIYDVRKILQVSLSAAITVTNGLGPVVQNM